MVGEASPRPWARSAWALSPKLCRFNLVALRMSDRVRPSARVAAAVVDDPLDHFDDVPSSEVRPVAIGDRSLVVSTGQSGAAAQEAWVTVADASGVVYFEGHPDADGSVAVSLEGAPHAETVLVLLETARTHRQAEVVLGKGRTAHTFD
jgi:hypothetical protein